MEYVIRDTAPCYSALKILEVHEIHFSRGVEFNENINLLEKLIGNSREAFKTLILN